ncbi:uncharacterized protein LOC117167665 isoform X3 [Belonocnema kinseyi]|uniref:uncharacterized protein LOC117167665 isoform X3 n=1 Tax=Belonocnema kinseyi TaxID=2817044 RepID=UPI00143CCA0F|nr:uncharacterized protein LOC117167665 isoform X3 [Belonocnema kinseyi]
MAEVGTKKSMNVVSKKNNEVCSVHSNNSLIDLDNISTSNNQLISLCDDEEDDDELILSNNTKNELTADDKSLQELIENELALRICSGLDDEEEVEEEEEDSINVQPEIKKIVIEPRQDPLDVNAEFIVAEIDHYSLIEEPYGYQNGHIIESSPKNQLNSSVSHEMLEENSEQGTADFPNEEVLLESVSDVSLDRSSKEVTEKEVFPADEVKEVHLNNSDDVLSDVVDHLENSKTTFDQYLNEQNIQKILSLEDLENVQEDSFSDLPEADRKLAEFGDPWSDLTSENLLQSHHISKFSDDFNHVPNQSQSINDSLSSKQEINSSSQSFDAKDSNISSEILDSSSELDSSRSDFDTSRNFDSSRNNLDSSRDLDLKEPISCKEALGVDEKDCSPNRDTCEGFSGRKIEVIRVGKIMDNDECLSDSTKTDLETSINTSGDVENDNPKVCNSKKVVNGMSQFGAISVNCTKLKPAQDDFDSWTTVGDATIEENEVESRIEENNEVKMDGNGLVQNCREKEYTNPEQREDVKEYNVAPLATVDVESSEDSSYEIDSENREEVLTTSTVVTSSSTTTKTKTKKKKIEGTGSDASPNHTPRTKKTKKSKKSDLEKENISVNGNLADPSMHTSSRQVSSETNEISDEDDLSNVNVKSLCRSFGDISNMSDGEQVPLGNSEHAKTQEKAKSMGDLRLWEQERSQLVNRKPIFTGVSVKALKTSFNKFDALSKKSVLHVRSVDAGKVQQQLNAVGQNGDANSNCRSCGKVVFQMEQTKAEGLVWHKNCFRCVQCSKQLSVDNYESHESTLYCKAHFKELFLPKPVEESDQPVRPRKPEMIIRENQPKELPPDVVRASDKPDLGLEELSTLNVKSRFQVFEKASTETTNDIERSSSQVAVKRSPSILSKLAKFQAKGMDIGVADESLNGIPYEESSESEEEIEEEETEELETEIIRAKRGARERPISFTKMDDMKNRWETTSQQGRRESQREARKEEIAGIRSRLFMGKQGKMKELYQQAVADSERVTKINAAEEIQHATNARSIKEKFEKGEPIATSDDENDGKLKQEKPDEEVIAAGISRKSRSLFLELDATAAKTGRPVTPVNHKSNTETPRRARDAFMGRQVSDDVVRSTDTTEEVQVETSDISNKFKFFETYREPEKRRRQFRITPPRDGQEKMSSPDREIYRDPDVIRADDKAEEVVHSDTARKMLSIFRQMEENATKEDLPDGPKPLKRFTPPPEDKFAKTTASESEDEEDEEAEESEDDNPDERDPNYVRASDKVEDEFLKQAQNAARAKTLRAKFEQWETTDGKTTSHNVAEMEMAQGTGDQSSIESASSLRARFESLGSQSSENPRTPKVKVNRFVEIQSNCTEICESCEKKVYPLEKVETNNKIFHKQCFRCLQCNCILRMDTFTLNNGKLYCIPHFKQLFITRGNYDEGFGVDPHKNKWTTNTSNSPPAPTPIAVSNGDL